MANSTILALVQDVAGELGLTIPTTAAQSSDPQIQQLVRIASKVGRELVKEYAWQALSVTYTFPTVNGVGSYALPSDYDRISPQTEWDRTNHWPLLGPKTAAEWAFLQGGIVSTGPRLRFRILQNQVQVFPLPGGAYTLAFEYISNGWVLPFAGGSAQRFSLDTDTCVFDDTLMMAAMELRWLERKGLDSSAAADHYSSILSMRKAQDADAPVLSVSRRQSPLLISPANLPESNYGL